MDLFTALPEVFAGALASFQSGDLAGMDAKIDRLCTAQTDRFSDLSELLVAELSLRLRRLWRSGWQPRDVTSVTRFLLDADHAAIVAAAIVHDAKRDPEKSLHLAWAAQLIALGNWWELRDVTAGNWLYQVIAETGLSTRVVLEISLGFLAKVAAFPTIATLIPAPGQATAHDRRTTATDRKRGVVEGKILRRIRSILAKAESSVFPNEVDSFNDKAQHLMTRYSISLAMVDAEVFTSEGPHGQRIHLEAPYVEAKASLVAAIGAANHCRVIFDRDLGFVTVFGFTADLAMTDLLFTSLLIQASTAVIGATRDFDRGKSTKTKTFRQAFFVSYAHQVGARLQASAGGAQRDFMHKHGTETSLVLKNRDIAVDDVATTFFPKTVRKSQRVTNEAGWTAGVNAADNSDLWPR